MDREALLNAIREFPDEDTPRLAYADWLDENCPAEVVCSKCRGKRTIPDSDMPAGYRVCPSCRGTGSVPSPGRGHAEFIRIQCEIPRIVCLAPSIGARESGSGNPLACWQCRPRGKRDCLPWCDSCERLSDCVTRQNELRPLHEDAWRPGPKCETCKGRGDVLLRDRAPHMSRSPKDRRRITCGHCDGTGDAGGLLRRLGYTLSIGDGREPVRIEFRRGFIEVIMVPRMVDVAAIRPQDPRLGLDARMERYETPPPIIESTPLLRQFLAPTSYRCLRGVIPLDMEPSNYDPRGLNVWGWHCGTHDTLPLCSLPGALWVALDKTSCVVRGRWADYPTRDAAVSALGSAVVRFGKQSGD